MSFKYKAQRIKCLTDLFSKYSPKYFFDHSSTNYPIQRLRGFNKYVQPYFLQYCSKKYKIINNFQHQVKKIQDKQMQKEFQTENIHLNNQPLLQKKQIQQINPVDQYEQELFSQMVTYQKNSNHQNSKTRGTKRKEKLHKLRTNLKDPQLRRERNRQRHQKQKEKLQKQLQGLSEQQIKVFLANRKKQKEELKEKVKKAVENQVGIPFLIDIAYEHKMNEKQNKSLATQIQLIMKAVKRIQTPPNVHLCGLKGKVKEQLQKMTYQYWPLKSYDEDLAECLKMDKFKNKNVYYLSPDAKQSLHNVEQNDIFIIGGLVDRTVIKNASLLRAEQLGIQARSLPIRSFMKQRTCLNLDHIVSIICKFVEVQDWKIAFDYGAPKRWKKDQEKNPSNKQKKQESQSDQQIQQQSNTVQKQENKKLD